jgi:hypothetical protein
MTNLRAHLASFPARSEVLEPSLKSVVDQVNEVHLVLNEYEEIPAFLAKYQNVNPIIPDQDYKDVGKFVTTPADDDIVFFIDDDLSYSDGYFDYCAEQGSLLGLDKHVFGLHSSIYDRNEIENAGERKHYYYRKPYRRARYVEQVATNSAFALGKNIAPLSYMDGSQKFVDVRYAKWCFEQGLRQITIRRPINMARPLRHESETIFRSFTVNSPDHVLDEIRSFARKAPDLGAPVGPSLSLLDIFRSPRSLIS